MMRASLFALVLSLALCASAGCTRAHVYRLDRLTEPLLVTSSSLASDAYTPIAFLKVVRWRFDPGSLFKGDYESPVGFQVLNDFVVKKALALGADAVVDVRWGYGGGLLFAHAWLEGMAVKREAVTPAPAHPMPPVVVPDPGTAGATAPEAGAGGAPLAPPLDALPRYEYTLSR